MGPMTMAGIGKGLGGIAGYFGAQNNARGYEQFGRNIGQGMDENRRFTGQANEYMTPYYHGGVDQLKPYTQNYSRMLDPNSFINDQMSGYMESPWAKMQTAKGQNAISNAASAGGGLGGTNYLSDMGDYARNITAADQQNHFNNLMGVWNQGLSRQGDMANQGYNAGNQMGQNWMNFGNNNMTNRMRQSQTDMERRKAENGGWSSLLGGITGMFGG